MESKKKVVELNVNDILPNRFQPRIKFDETAINDLADSIKEHGVIQPIVVRKIGDKYEIIAGERRYKASCMAGLETIPAIITELNDKDSAEVALIENVQRQNLTPIEEAISYKKILDMGYLTQEQLATKLGKSQSAIANKLRLLNLDDDVQEALLNGDISERHARSLLKLTNPKQQVKMLNRIIDERLTVRKTDEEIDKMLNDLFEADEEVEESAPEETETEIEHTQPLTFNFESYDDEKEENVFDTETEPEKEENVFDIGEEEPEEEKEEPKDIVNTDEVEESSKDETDFFGFNQNLNDEEDIPKDLFNLPEEKESEGTDFFGFNQAIDDEPTKESVEDEYSINNNDFVDVNQIENEAEDLYPKEEKKDINSFLEPTLLINDDEEEPEEEKEEPKEEAKVEEEPKEEQPVEEEDMRPGRFFNLFNNFGKNEEEPVTTSVSDDNIEYNRFDEQPETSNFNVFNSFDDEENNEVEVTEEKPEISKEEEPEEKEEPELTEVVPQKLESEDISELNNDSQEESNINVALSKIKEYAEELKKLGIDMNIEESDFENKYQITINIDK